MHSIARAPIDSHLGDTTSDGANITRIPECKATKSSDDSLLRTGIGELVEPIDKPLKLVELDQVSISYGIQASKQGSRDRNHGYRQATPTSGEDYLRWALRSTELN